MLSKKKILGLTAALMIFGGNNFIPLNMSQNVCVAAETSRFTVEKANNYINMPTRHKLIALGTCQK